MSALGFGQIWNRIEANGGETFAQLRGGEFTYEVRSGSVWPDRTSRGLPRSHFEQAFDLVPFSSTVPLQHLQGPSYLYAIFMDDRIRQDDW